MKNHLILSIICLLIAFQNVAGQENKKVKLFTNIGITAFFYYDTNAHYIVGNKWGIEHVFLSDDLDDNYEEQQKQNQINYEKLKQKFGEGWKEKYNEEVKKEQKKLWEVATIVYENKEIQKFLSTGKNKYDVWFALKDKEIKGLYTVLFITVEKIEVPKLNFKFLIHFVLKVDIGTKKSKIVDSLVKEHFLNWEKKEAAFSDLFYNQFSQYNK